MFTNGALKQLIALEEKKPDHGQLITSAYDNDEFFVPAPFEWQLGSLFVGVLNTNHERVLVFMYIGAVDDNRLCVTIDHAPILLSFNTVSLQQRIFKFSKSYNSRANRELMYVLISLCHSKVCAICSTCMTSKQRQWKKPETVYSKTG
jgi:hypothetical protein